MGEKGKKFNIEISTYNKTQNTSAVFSYNPKQSNSSNRYVTSYLADRSVVGVTSNKEKIEGGSDGANNNNRTVK